MQTEFTQATTITLALIGFEQVSEYERITKLFVRAGNGQYQWQIVDNIKQADIMVIVAETEQRFTQLLKHYSPTIEQPIIAYSPLPFKQAKWHLYRPSAARNPSLLDFLSLIKAITQDLNKSAPLLNLPSKTTSQAVVNLPKVVISPKSTLNLLHNHPQDLTKHLKVVITGSVGSGKTTAVKALADGNAITTEAIPSDQAQLLKKTTTVAMDYVAVDLDTEKRLHVYGTPGQRRFDFMGDILTHKAAGLVILVNNTFSNPLNELNYYLNQHKRFLAANKAVIGITHNDISPQPSLKEYQHFLHQNGFNWPAVKLDARRKSDVLNMLSLLVN